MVIATYNKIPETAYVRRLVLDEFGVAMRHYWPLVETMRVQSDLVRSRELVGFNVEPGYLGPVDGSVYVSSGYLSDVVPDLGSGATAGSDGTQWQAVDVPAGVWEGITLNKGSAGGSVDVYVAYGELNPSDVPGLAMITKTGEGSGASQGQDFTVTFPFPLVAQDNQFRVYLEMKNSMSLGKHDVGELNEAYDWQTSGSYWRSGHQLYSVFRGRGAKTWPSIDDFTVGVMVNIDAGPGGGAAVSISDATTDRFRISVTSDKKPEGFTKNTSGAERLLSGTAPLPPGFNLLTLSYQRNGLAKLGVNGAIVASGAVTDFGLFNGAMYVGVGAVVENPEFPYTFPFSFRGVSKRLRDSLIADVWMADDVPVDSVLREIYEQYISVFPVVSRIKPMEGEFPYRFPITLG